MTKLICGWCNKGFEAIISIDKHNDRNLLNCPHCGRLLPSSKRESTGELSGRKHFHREWKDGDIVR